MGRKKIYKRRFLIGLDAIQSDNLVRMSNMLGLTYSEVMSYLMDYYQLGESSEKGK